MPLTVLEHALGGHLLAQLRDETTPPQRFRTLTRALTHILVVEATRNLPTRTQIVRTPLEDTDMQVLDTPLVAVPVLRAGLGMLDAVLELLPEAAVGYVGLERDETTAVASAYYCKLPPLQGRATLLLDPMLATGGSAASAIRQLIAGGASRLQLLCIVAAPEGVKYLEAEFPDLHIVTAALDRELNEKRYILPGLGDFGDRLFGTF